MMYREGVAIMISNDSDREAEQVHTYRVGERLELRESVSRRDGRDPCLYKSRDKSGGLVNVRMSSMVFLPLRGHTVQKVSMTMPATGLEKLGVFSSKVTAALTPPRPRGVRSRLNRKWPCIPRLYVQCQGQLFPCVSRKS